MAAKKNVVICGDIEHDQDLMKVIKTTLEEKWDVNAYVPGENEFDVITEQKLRAQRIQNADLIIAVLLTDDPGCGEFTFKLETSMELAFARALEIPVLYWSKSYNNLRYTINNMKDIKK